MKGFMSRSAKGLFDFRDGERICGTAPSAAPRLLIAVPYPPPDPKAGGAELFVMCLIEELTAAYDWEIAVVTTMPKSKVHSEVTPANVKVYRLPYRFIVSNSPVSLSWVYDLKRIVAHVNPDVINIHMPVPGLGDMVSHVAGHRPVVIYYHFGSMKKGNWQLDPLIGLYESFLLPSTLRKASQLACGNSYVKEGVLRGVRDKTSIIAPGVDSARFCPALRRVTHPHVLYVGSLNQSDQHKRFGDLLEACKTLRLDLPGLHLTAVGGGDGRRMFQEMATRLGIADIVDFRGRLEGDALADAYRNAAVLAVPSLRETFGMVITEGMASGLPVVVVDGGGVRSLVDDGTDGLLVPPRDPRALAHALLSLLNNPERADAFGEAGRKKVSERFGWSHQVAAFNRILITSTGLPAKHE